MRRRQFLAATGAALSVTALPMAARAVSGAMLSPRRPPAKAWRRRPSATGLWLYDGVSPGLMIEAECEDLEVVFTNNLDVLATMHWHGSAI